MKYDVQFDGFPSWLNDLGQYLMLSALSRGEIDPASMDTILRTADAFAEADERTATRMDDFSAAFCAFVSGGIEQKYSELFAEQEQARARLRKGSYPDWSIVTKYRRVAEIMKAQDAANMQVMEKGSPE